MCIDENGQSPWRILPYIFAGRQVVANTTSQPPFDGGPVLLDTAEGILQGTWEPEHTSNGKTTPPCWSTMVGDYGWDEVYAWMPLPAKDLPYPGCLPPINKRVLMQSEHNGWIEALREENGDWLVMQGFFTIPKEKMQTWMILPVLTPETLAALKARPAETNPNQTTFDFNL